MQPPVIRGSADPQRSLYEANSLREQEGSGRSLRSHLLKFARENPAAALWCLGIGFIVGWRVKPW